MDIFTSATTMVGLLGFFFSAWKYFDTRKFEAKNVRFSQFRQTFIWFAGRTEEGQLLTAVQQAIATYQLMEFPEFKAMSLPIIEHLLGEKENPPLLQDALQEAKNQLQNSN